MFGAVAEFVSTQQGDSAEFVDKVRALAVGVARDYEPARLYVIRIDNWFGPKWMHFAGKFTVGKGFAVGAHKLRLHVPPFVPHRVIAERVFLGPEYDETVVAAPLHIYRLLSVRQRVAWSNSARAEHFTWVSRSVKGVGSRRCCVEFRVVRLRIFKRVVELWPLNLRCQTAPKSRVSGNFGHVSQK